jgi:peptidoglycan/xylan/chitin deacetylase (PgdA/CDA1 family)
VLSVSTLVGAVDAAPRPDGEVQVPILYYHRIQAPPAGFWSWPLARRQREIAYKVLPSAFAAQLDWLEGHGYTTILPRDLAAHWDRGTPLPPRPVIITFDDGTRDWTRTVLPLLRSHGMVAEFYLTLDAIRSGTITWAEVQTLAAAGNGIGAHHDHHVQLVNLGDGRPDASIETMRAELTDIRRVIATHVGVLPDSMAYVGGGYDATLMDVARGAGYVTARTTVPGRRQSTAHRYSLRVVHVGWQEDVANERLGRMVPGLPAFARSLGWPVRQPRGHDPDEPQRAGVSWSASPS